ncbi:MAG: hypothetical protein ACRBK7_17420 [Acidimicrobiales bacterium]
MICEPIHPCGGDDREPLTQPTPPPGLARLQRRIGHYDGLLDDLIRRSEQRTLSGESIGRRWDIEGDPQAMNLMKLWAYVAEGVAAYSELTAGEAYLSTAQDWLDLARLADQIGYRPSQRVAAEGWVRFETDRLASPLVPAGTRVQAPGTPERDPQTYEVIEDTNLQADWAGLTATWVPEATKPVGRTVRFLGDPGFRAGDDVLLIDEEQPSPSSTNWILYLLWLFGLSELPTPASVTPKAVLSVVGHEHELGTTLVDFDRDITDLLGDNTSYAAYRIVNKATSARRLSSVLEVSAGTATSVALPAYAQDAISDESIVLDREISELSTDSLVALVRWDSVENQGDIKNVKNHLPIEWEVAPGTPVLVSKLTFDATEEIGVLEAGVGPIDAYVLDRRVAVTHYRFPDETPSEAPGAGLRIRVWPAPSSPNPTSGRLAIQTDQDGVPTWELLEVGGGEVETQPGTDVTVGLILDVQSHGPEGLIDLSPASGNVVKVRHGITTSSALGSGDGVSPFRTELLPDDPIASVLGPDGAATNSLSLRVDGRAWTERETLFGAGPVDGYETRVGPDGEVEVRFGDGEDGAIPNGAGGSVEGTYRVGGGTAGEVATEQIDTLLGSIRGVRAVLGAGPTSNGADQPTERDLRSQAPTRARAMDRIVALGDVADLALAFPGVSHAAAWLGESPPGFNCGPGPTVAILRTGTDGIRAALPAELDALTTYLDARRDVTIPLCVSSAEVVPVTVSLTVAGDPLFDGATIEAGLSEALTDIDGILAGANRDLGQPLDRSDLVEIVHRVEGVVGIESLSLTAGVIDSATSTIGRLPAERYQLLVVQPPSIQVVFS